MTPSNKLKHFVPAIVALLITLGGSIIGGLANRATTEVALLYLPGLGLLFMTLTFLPARLMPSLDIPPGSYWARNGIVIVCINFIVLLFTAGIRG
jgi:hypothetical protein